MNNNRILKLTSNSSPFASMSHVHLHICEHACTHICVNTCMYVIKYDLGEKTFNILSFFPHFSFSLLLPLDSLSFHNHPTRISCPLYMCICMYMCMHVCIIYICMYLYPYIHIHIDLHTRETSAF